MSLEASKNKSDQYGVANYKYPKLTAPGNVGKIIMHSCCAPCASDIMQALFHSGIDVKILFYNPNIHPLAEYETRKSENKRYADKLNMEFVDLDYDRANWFERVKGLEMLPERGLRCTVCFDMRFERVALYAFENNYQVFTSSLGISRWKDFDQITNCGVRAAIRYPNIEYWSYNWRKKGGSMRMIEISKQERFYQQEYCGCVFSLRDTNNFRKSKNRPKILRNVKFYGDY